MYNNTIRRHIKTTVKVKPKTYKVKKINKDQSSSIKKKNVIKKAKKATHTKNIVGQKSENKSITPINKTALIKTSKKASTQINETTLFNLVKSSYDKGRKHLSVYGNEKFTNVIKEKVEPKVLNESQYFTVFELLLPRLDDLLDIYKDNLPFLYRGLSEIMRYSKESEFAVRQIFKIEKSDRKIDILENFSEIKKLKHINPGNFKLYDLASKELDKEKQREQENEVFCACKAICPNVLNIILQELEKLPLFKKQCELYGAELIEKGDDFFFHLKDFSQTKFSKALSERKKNFYLWDRNRCWSAHEKDRCLAKDTKALRYKDEVVTHVNEVKISIVDDKRLIKSLGSNVFKKLIIRDEYTNIYTSHLPLKKKRNATKKSKKIMYAEIKKVQKDKKRKIKLLNTKPSIKRKPRTKVGCFTVFSRLEKSITEPIISTTTRAKRIKEKIQLKKRIKKFKKEDNQSTFLKNILSNDQYTEKERKRIQKRYKKYKKEIADHGAWD